MDIIRVSHKKVYDRDKFIKKVKRLQKDVNTTQAYIGQVIGRDASTMSRMINKEFDFSLNDAAALHEAFDVDLNYLIADDKRYGLYCTTEKADVSRFDYLLGDLLLEIDQAPRGEHDEMLGKLMVALGKQYGVIASK